MTVSFTKTKADSRHPEELLSAAISQRFGITRVGDVTDLDIIGIPVWFACRPNSRCLSVSQGKALRADMARIGAIMEAIEGAVAEATKPLISEIGSIVSVVERGMPIVPLDQLARCDFPRLDRQVDRAWVKGFSHRTGRDVYAPYELIGMDMRVDFPWDRTSFKMTSQGLAAGFDLDFATLRALLELVEHHSAFLIDALGAMGRDHRRLDYRGGINADLDEAVRRLANAGITPEFYDITSNLAVPAVMAVIPRDISAPSGPATRRSAGLACRLDLAEAALAALLEAVQSRLTDISGARDDLEPSRYGPTSAPDHRPTMGTPLDNRRLDLAPDPVVPEPVVPDWQRLAAWLIERGVEDIYVFPLPTGVDGVVVVRVLVPGLSVASTGLQIFSANALGDFLGRAGVR